MKNILCYGDSLTWGYSPQGTRHDFVDRWPSVLNEELGLQNARVFNEGLNGRTTVFDDFAVAANRNGAQTLPTILDTHTPLDLVIIMLGTNDLKNYLCGNVTATTRGVGRLVEIIKSYPYFLDVEAPPILIVSPPHCVETEEPVLAGIFDGAVEKSKEFAQEYKALSELTGCTFFDAATIANASSIDGVHLDATNTRAIGKNIAPLVEKILKL